MRIGNSGKWRERNRNDDCVHEKTEPIKEALNDLTEKQIAFICTECGITVDELFALNEDDVYDAMCDIELAEIPSDDSPESERCILASDIVTVLGNALAIAEGVMYEDNDDEDIDE